MKFRRIVDISRPIYTGMTVWPGDGGVQVDRSTSIAKGDFCNVTRTRMSVHSGTHVDAPLHFLDNSTDVASMDLNLFTGLVKIIEVKVEKCIDLKSIEKLDIRNGDAVFFKTSNSELAQDSEFRTDYVYMDMSAAKYLIEKRVRTIGIDYYSIEEFDAPGNPVHKIVLGSGIAIVEGLVLKNVQPGEYIFSCLPLRIEGSDGSPVRAVLMEPGE